MRDLLSDARPICLDRVWASASDRLSQAGIGDATLEAEVLLRHALGINRASFLAEQRDPVSDEAAAEFDRLLDRRVGREPLAYIMGRREFYGTDFAVTPAVLVPRQETELLVDLAVERLNDMTDPRAIDVGTGSGCVALAIALHASSADVHAIDVSEDALTIAARNRETHGLTDRVLLYEGDFMSPFAGDPGRWDVIVSNPPYMPSAVLDTLAPEVRAEPPLALDGGPGGLAPTRKLMEQAPGLLAEGGYLLIEIYSDSAPEAERLAIRAFPKTPVAVHRDLLGLARVLEIGPANRT